MSILRLRGRAASLVGILAAVALLGSASPAAAQTGTADGVVTGTVNVPQGVPLTPLDPGDTECDVVIAGENVERGINTTFEFQSTEINGAFTGEGDDVISAVGDVEVSATGSGCDSGGVASGIVDTITDCDGGGTIVASDNVNLITANADLSCVLPNGVFVRVGPLVIVLFTAGLIKIDYPGGLVKLDDVDVKVAALFVPLDVDDCAGNPCVRDAAFGGSFLAQNAA